MFKVFCGVPIRFKREKALLIHAGDAATALRVEDQVDEKWKDQYVKVKWIRQMSHKSKELKNRWAFLDWIEAELVEKTPHQREGERIRELLESEAIYIDLCKMEGKPYRGRMTKVTVTHYDHERSMSWETIETMPLMYIENKFGKRFSIIDYYEKTRGMATPMNPSCLYL